MREVPKGNQWETPLTMDAYSDSSGLASKTIKTLREQGNLSDAKTYGNKWLEIHGNHAQVLTTLVIVYLVSAQGEKPDPDDPKTAEQLARAALRLKPDDPEIAKHLATALAMQGKIPEAISVLEQALAKNPKHRDSQDLLRRLQDQVRPRKR